MAKPTANEFVAALRQVEEAGNVEAMVALYAEDARLSNPTDQKPHEGPEGARTFWTAYRKSFEHIHSRFHVIAETDAAATLEWTSECRTAAGVETHYDGVSVYEARDGRITRFVAYFDPADLGTHADAQGAAGANPRADAYGTAPASVDSSEVAAKA
jgi:ketosteroid isomerase-like protein